MIFLLFLLGFVSGTVGALVGIGGGLIIVPVLTVVFELPIQTAIATGLVCVIATSISASARYVRQGLANVRVGTLLELGATLGAVTGASLVALLSQASLKILFGVLLFAASCFLYRGPSAKEVGQTQKEYAVRHHGTGIAVSYVTGSVSGLLGIGGGPIQVPLLHLVMNLPLKAAVATSNFIMGVTASAGAIVYYLRQDIDIAVTAPVMLGILFGARFGSFLLQRVRAKWVKWILTVVLFYLGVTMWLEAFAVPIPWR